MLAVAVMDDLDVTPHGDGFEVARDGLLTWEDIATALGDWAKHPAHPVSRARLATLITAARLVAAGGPAALARSMQVHVEPAASVLNPGSAWPVERVGAGPLVAGWGLVGVAGTELTRPLPLSPSIRAAIRAAIVAGDLQWSSRRADVDRLTDLLTERLAQDVAAGRTVVLRPQRRTDVPTLLLSRGLRSWLAARDGSGMAAVAVPTRSRGWSDLRRIDPGFVRAAWSATEPLDRGFEAALLVTADDAVLPRGASAGGVGHALGSPLADPLVHPVAAHPGRH